MCRKLLLDVKGIFPQVKLNVKHNCSKFKFFNKKKVSLGYYELAKIPYTAVS